MQVNKESIFSKKKILVTGASGFIGSHLCKRLLSLGAEVAGVHRNSEPNPQVCSHWEKADLSSIEDVKKAVGNVRPDMIFHLASHVVGARGIEQVIPTFNDNFASSVNLLVEATKVGCERIVLVGSLEEPDSPNNCIPSSPYAAAKFSASSYGRMFHALYDTPVTIARLFMVYGPGQRDRKKLVPFVIESLLNKKKPDLTSGTRLVDWIYVDDVVSGLLAMAEAQDVLGKTIDIGSGELHSVRTVVEKIVNIIDPEEDFQFGSLAERQMEQVRIANIDETRLKIGWQPELGISEGLRRTIDWYKTH